MKIKIGEIELAVSNADNSIYFGEETGTRRLSVTLSDNTSSAEELVYLKQQSSPIVLIVDENQSETFEDYSLENIRKSYGANSRITIDFLKK